MNNIQSISNIDLTRRTARPGRITRFLTALALTHLIAILGCADSTHSSYRDQQAEDIIKKFYSSNSDQLVINTVLGGSKLDVYCILVPYQNDLNNQDNEVLPANDFLRDIGLQSQESHWHIAVKSSDKFALLRFEQKSTPLLTPASHSESSCKAEGKITIGKT